MIDGHTEGETSRLLTDRKTRDAVVFNLAVIGEAVKTVSEDLRSTHPDIPWRRIAGMRDRLIHGYFAINDVLVAEVVDRELPKLRAQISEIANLENAV